MHTAELIPLLHQGAAAWNAWREGREDAAVRLAQERSPGVDLRDVVWGTAMRELIHADLKGADLRRLDLKGAKLGAYVRLLAALEKQGLGSGDLAELESVMIDLRNTDLSDVNLAHADLYKAQLSGANLEHANLRGANLSDADLENTRLTGAKLVGTNLTRARLRGAKLIGLPDSMVQDDARSHAGKPAGFYKPHLLGAIFDGADFTGARLSGLDLHDVPLGNAASLRKAHFVHADLSGVNLRNTDLREADLTGSDLTGADLTGAQINRKKRGPMRAGMLGSLSAAAADDLRPAILRNACLRGAILEGVDLSWMDLTGTTLIGVNLTAANLTGINFTNQNLEAAILSGADLSFTMLARTNLKRATLIGCRIHGLAAWSVMLDQAKQHDLVITAPEEPAVTVDDLELGQFIYLLLRNERIRSAIDTITSRVVLILGSFSAERKRVLDRLREELRGPGFGLVPIIFDFPKPESKDLTGTVQTLAHMARFIVVDLTDPSSVPHELATIVPDLSTTPVLPLRRTGSPEYALFQDYHRRYKWVLGTHEYHDVSSLIPSLPALIASADKLVKELRASSQPGTP